MLQELQVKFSNFLLSLSDAMDMASPPIASHQMRTAFIAWKIASEANLPAKTIEKIYLGALLHDIGALSLEEKYLLHRGYEDVNAETHCILGEALYDLSPLLEGSAKIVRYHHHPWKNWKNEGATIDSPDVAESQILLLADELERAVSRDTYILHQVERLNSEMVSLAGTKVYPDFVDVFLRVSRQEDFWLDLVSPRLYSILLHFGPFRSIEMNQSDIFSIASIFRHVIDFKSRFTATHSTGVAECAVMLARDFGLTDSEVGQIRIAGYLHDLGKLAVPNAILEKPGRLTKEEFDIIKQHTYFTYSVLNTIGGLDTIAEWAAFHHEKLDGSGYPFHICEEKLNTGARILAASDIFAALIEDRPYRKGMERKQIESILLENAEKRALDKRIVHIILEDFDRISRQVKSKQEESARIFEEKFLRLKSKVA